MPRIQVKPTLAAFAEACRDRRIKATRQRMEILRELGAAGRHPDAETIHRGVRRRMPAISLDTVYRTLRTLAEKGVISRVPSTSDRARFDANTGRHHHFVCRTCGRIEDFESAQMDGLASPEAVAGMGEVETVHVELRGRCRGCLSRPAGGGREGGVRGA